METIKESSLKSREQIRSDLNNLLLLVNDGRDGYQRAAELTKSDELKTLFLEIEGERIVYASELSEQIASFEETHIDEKKSLFGSMHLGWITIKQLLTGNSNKAILEAIITGETAALAKYDEYIAEYTDHAVHLELLKEQRAGIAEAKQKIMALAIRF